RRRGDLLLVRANQFLHSCSVVTRRLGIAREGLRRRSNSLINFLVCKPQVLQSLRNILGRVLSVLFRLGDLSILLCQFTTNLRGPEVVPVGHSNTQLVLEYLTVGLERPQFCVQLLDPNTC